MTDSESSTDMRRDNVHIFSEFEDTDRQSYIRKILPPEKDIFGGIPRQNFFHLWFADKEAIRQMAYCEGDWDSNRIGQQLYLSPSVPEADPVEVFINGVTRGQPDELVSVPDPSQVKKALMRDRNECVLTHHGVPGAEVAHIVNPRLNKVPEGTTWFILQSLWGNKVKAWREAIIGADKCFDTNRTSNMISLNRLVRGHWDNSQCALRPVRVADDQMSMDIAFHWLPLPTGHKADMLPIDRNPYGDGAEKAIARSPGENFKAFDCETDRVILSGDIFTITTTDKVERPLPSKDLLDLMWILKRIAAMQGAGGPTCREDKEDPDMESLGSYTDDD